LPLHKKKKNRYHQRHEPRLARLIRRPDSTLVNLRYKRQLRCSRLLRHFAQVKYQNICSTLPMRSVPPCLTLRGQGKPLLRMNFIVLSPIKRPLKPLISHYNPHQYTPPKSHFRPFPRSMPQCLPPKHGTARSAGRPATKQPHSIYHHAPSTPLSIKPFNACARSAGRPATKQPVSN